MSVRIRLSAGVAGFAEDKDYARDVRTKKILPALARDGQVVLDFDRVRYATQSFIHALIGEALKRHGEGVLERIEFANCSPQIRSVIELVVEYSLGGFPLQSESLSGAGYSN